MDVTRGEYTISTDRARVPLGVVHRFLSEESYWAKGIPLATVQTSLQNSLVFGIYKGGRARRLRARHHRLRDVRLRGGRVRAERAPRAGPVQVAHGDDRGDPRLGGFRRWILATRDAHGLYAQSGYAPLAAPERWMEWKPVAGYEPAPPESATGPGSGPPPR